MSQDGYSQQKTSISMHEPVDEQLTIEVSTDKLEAIGIIQPASLGGGRLEKEDILLALEKAGIKYGINHSSIDAFIEKRQYDNRGVLLAQGLAPVECTDAVIEYKFETDKEKKPKANEDGSVNFRELDLINHVYIADLLAVLTPAKEGVPGMDVYGKPIRTRFPKRLTLKFGKNVAISEDKCSLYAEKPGFVFMDGDRVAVSQEYIVEGDVGTSVGNINFDGDITIRGNVQTGYTIEASGSIHVDGVVEGATLIAGNQIVIAHGVQGGGKALLKAKGNIIANFIESSTVETEGYVATGAIMHSKVSAKGDIIVDQKKGLVVGGELMSGTMISVKTAGSAIFGTNTLLEVGLPPTMMKDYRRLEKDIADKQKEQKSLQQALELLNRKMNSPEGLTDDKKMLLQKVTKQVIMLSTEMKQMLNEYSIIKRKMENYTPGKIKVEHTIYTGVKVVISNVSYYVRSDLQYCQFVKNGSDIRFVPY